MSFLGAVGVERGLSGRWGKWDGDGEEVLEAESGREEVLLF